MVADADLRTDFLPPLTEGIRKEESQIAASTPLLNQVTDTDLQQFEADRERERKKKRGARSRRMVALPDREPIKTNRTRVSSGVDDKGLPMTRPAGPSRLALVPPPVLKVPSRRAAAIAAQASITYMANDPPEEDEVAEASQQPLETPASSQQYHRGDRSGDLHSGKRKSYEDDQIAEPADSKRLRAAAEWSCEKCGKHRTDALRENSAWLQQGREQRLCPRCGECED